MGTTIHFLSAIDNPGYFEGDVTALNPFRDEMMDKVKGLFIDGTETEDEAWRKIHVDYSDPNQHTHYYRLGVNTETNYSIATEALETIARPIAYLQKEAEMQGAQLDGRYAIALSKDPNWLMSKASEALTKIQDNGDGNKGS